MRATPATRAAADTPADGAAARRARATARAQSAEGRRLEAEIAEVEAALAEARRRLLDPETFRDPQVGAEAGREHDRLTGALAELYDRWATVAGSQRQ